MRAQVENTIGDLQQRSNYRPWLSIRDVPSRGFLARVRGWKSGREHHLLSKLELHYFLALDLSPSVVEICEQFPLLPLRETQEIARRIGIRHPTDPKTRRAAVMTTDFVFCLRTSNEEKVVARAAKYSSALRSARTLQKLELERQYWQRREIDWGIVPEREFTAALIRNLEWLHPCASLSDFATISSDQVAKAEQVLRKKFQKGKQSIAHLATSCDRQLKLAPGVSLTIVRHLIATGRWKVDWFTPIDSSKPLGLLPTFQCKGGRSAPRAEHADSMGQR